MDHNFFFLEAYRKKTTKKTTTKNNKKSDKKLTDFMVNIKPLES